MPDCRRIALLSLASVSLLGGCAMFAPRYDATLDAKASGAYEQVAHLAASGELGSYADKASFTATAPFYAEAHAQLAVAKMRATALPVQGRRAEAARASLVTLIDGCSARVTSFAAQHRKFGIQPETGASQSMMITCDQAARAARVMKPGD